MSVYSSGPIHTKAQWRRPTLVRTSASDRSRRYLGPLRSSCGHILGIAGVWRGRQFAWQFKDCAR